MIESSPKYPGIALSRLMDPSKGWTANDRALVSAVRILALCLLALVVLSLAPVTAQMFEGYPFLIGFLVVPIVYFAVRSVRLFIKQVGEAK